MVRDRPSSLPTAASLAISVTIHAIVLLLLLGVMAGTALPQGIDRDEPVDDRQPEEDPEVLGIDDSVAETLTWIGYDEYEEHLARLSEVEQAAMAQGLPSGGGGGPTANSSAASRPAAPPSPPAAVRPPSASAATTAPAIPTETPEVSADPEVRTEPRATPSETPRETESETPSEATTSETAPTESPTTTPAEETTPRESEEESAEASETVPDTPTEESPAETPAESPTPTPEPTPEPAPTPAPEPTPTPTPTPTPAPTPAPEPSDAPGQGDGEGPAAPQPEPGNDSDRDSEATSLVDTPQSNWRNGKPLAAQGLEIKPRRLQIPLLTWNKIRPNRTPVAELEFDRTGRPRTARLTVGSGDDLLDGYIGDALYRWRASGRRLQALEGDETVTIRLRLLMK